MGGSGIRTAVGAVGGLCSRWKAGNLLQWAYGLMGLMNWTVETLRHYKDPVPPADLFVFFTGNLVDWRHP